MRPSLFHAFRRRQLALSVRLTLWHSLLFFGSALALLGLTYALLRNRAYATERDTIEFRLKQYATEYQQGGLDAVQRLAAQRKGRAQKAFFVRVDDRTGVPSFRRDPDDWAEFEPERLGSRRLSDAGTHFWQTLHSPAGTELLVASARLPDGGVLHVGKSNEELRELLAEYRHSAFLVLLIFVPASFAGGAFLASRALRPVQHLTGAAQEIIATGRFDARVPARGSGDELDALVRVFNEMLGRIDALVRGMRDSIDNVAHDLRTPLTRLRARAQSVLKADAEWASSPPCPRCEPAMDALAGCVDDNERVTTMLDTLMDIAETEAGLVRLRAEPLSAAKLIANCVESFAEFAEERGIMVTTEVSPALQLLGDPIALGRVFANLLDNGIKCTEPGGSVRIIALPRDGIAEIRFEDNGIGISPEDLPRIWERLFRSDRSRSERGLGLGLSFVRALVQAHGGTVAAESEPGQGTIIRLTLPLVPATDAEGNDRR